MAKKPFEINLRTPREKYSREENNKLFLHLRQDEFSKELRDDSRTDIEWQSEQIAKSHGIYLEFDRAKTGTEKDWMYMIRIAIPGGGPITRKQWNLFNELADKYTKDTDGIPTLRLTNRQTVQFHWLNKQGVLEIVKRVAEAGYNSLNGCGDNTRNVMCCPLSRFSDVFNTHELAQKAALYFQLPLEPFIKVFAIDPKYIRKPDESFQYGPGLLNRKFKIAFASVHKDPLTGKLTPDNCAEIRTNDLAVAPVIEDGKVTKFQIFIGGGQGERNGKLAMATLGLPFCQTDHKQLFIVMDAIVKVHQEWGDRENRWWARLKYVVKKMGIDWYRDQVSSIVGFPLMRADEGLDYGDRHLHFGWTKQPSNNLWSFGAFIENGRISDISPNGKLKQMITHLMNKYDIEMMITPNQDAIFSNIPENLKNDFEKDLKSFGWGKRNGKEYSTLRLHSGACVGRDTCRLTYTDSEKFEPFLVDELEQMGWGNIAESIGITGCERQCFRPATKSIGLIGSGMDRYKFKLFGDETGRFQGQLLMPSSGDVYYLGSVPREKCAVVIDALFKHHEQNHQEGEKLGAFLRRQGPDAIIKFLKENPATAELMTKPLPADYVLLP